MVEAPFPDFKPCTNPSSAVHPSQKISAWPSALHTQHNTKKKKNNTKKMTTNWELDGTQPLLHSIIEMAQSFAMQNKTSKISSPSHRQLLDLQYHRGVLELPVDSAYLTVKAAIPIEGLNFIREREKENRLTLAPPDPWGPRGPGGPGGPC